MNTDLAKPQLLAKIDIDPTQMEHLMTIISALMLAVSQEVLSGDLLMLIFYRARNIAATAGVPETVVTDLLEKMYSVMDRQRRRNPISDMMP